MMKIAAAMTMVLLLAMSSLPAGGKAGDRKTFTTNKHVEVELRAPGKISSEKEQGLAFFLTPVDGIHINTTPAFELLLEKNSQFELAGKARFSKDEHGYLDTDKPVEFFIKTKSGIPSGRQTIKGKLNYFYCSDKEGWCNRFSQPFEVSIDVAK